MRTFLRAIQMKHDPVLGLTIGDYPLDLASPLLTLIETFEQNPHFLKIALLFTDHDNKEKSLSIRYIASSYDRTRTLTIKQYFTEIGNQVLPWDNELPNYEVSSVYAIDAHLWDFKATPVKLGFDPSTPIAEEDKLDLLMTKPGLDMRYLLDRSLVFINGFCHYTDSNEDSLFVKDGFKSQIIGDDNQIDIMDFERIGKITRIDISKNNLIKPIPGLKVSQQLYLNFPKLNLTNKKVAISIGGFLHFVTPNDTLFTKVGATVFKLDFNKFNWPQRYLMIRDNLIDDNFKMLRYDDKRIDMEALFSEETIIRLLEMSQTFLVLIESNGPLYHASQTLGDFSVPGRYEHHDTHRYPVRCSDGRYLPYLLFRQKPYSIIQTVDTRHRWYVDYTTDYRDDASRPFYEQTNKDQVVKLAEMTLIQAYTQKG